MEELLELKQLLQKGEVTEALFLIEEMEELGKKAIYRTIRSYVRILLLNLIKQKLENRSTKSWEASIRNAVREIKDVNARPKGRGVYLNEDELRETIASALDSAIEQAAIEAAEGIYDFRAIERMIDSDELSDRAYASVCE